MNSVTEEERNPFYGDKYQLIIRSLSESFSRIGWFSPLPYLRPSVPLIPPLGEQQKLSYLQEVLHNSSLKEIGVYKLFLF